MTQAFSKSKDTLFLLFESPCEIAVQLIQEIQALFRAVTEPVRPGENLNGSINSTSECTIWII